VNEPASPFAVISKDSILVHESLDTFALANKRGIEQGYFRDAWIVDARGEAYLLESFEMVSEPFWKRPKLPGGGRPHRLKNLVFRPLGPVDVANVVARVEEAMRVGEVYWDARGDVEAVRKRLAKAISVRDVIEVLLAP
jgi:hypothetical protein